MLVSALSVCLQNDQLKTISKHTLPSQPNSKRRDKPYNVIFTEEDLIDE